MGFGQTLREAREAKGYTIAQMADMTHIMARTIEGLETEDFSSLAAPIYGRGFVKLCCQTLGLDPKPMIDEFMALYNGEKPVAAPFPAAEQPKEPEPPAKAQEPVTEPPLPIDAAPPPVEPIRPHIQAPVEDPPSAAPREDLFTDEQDIAAARSSVGRFAPPRPQDDDFERRPIRLPSVPWRLVMLIFGAIAVIWAVVAGCRALYRSLGGGEEKNDPTVQDERTAVPLDGTGNDSAAPKAPRIPKPVKPLYID